LGRAPRRRQRRRRGRCQAAEQGAHGC
jgi:hypothetical protein